MKLKLEQMDGYATMTWLLPGVYVSGTKFSDKGGHVVVSIRGDVTVSAHPDDDLVTIDVEDPEWGQRFSLAVDATTFAQLKEAADELES